MRCPIFRPRCLARTGAVSLRFTPGPSYLPLFCRPPLARFRVNDVADRTINERGKEIGDLRRMDVTTWDAAYRPQSKGGSATFPVASNCRLRLWDAAIVLFRGLIRCSLLLEWGANLILAVVKKQSESGVLHRLAVAFLIIVSESRTTSVFSRLFSFFRVSSTCFSCLSRSISSKRLGRCSLPAVFCIIHFLGSKRAITNLWARIISVNLVSIPI
jgi:hypothetical protein